MNVPSKAVPELLQDSLIRKKIHTASSHPVHDVHGQVHTSNLHVATNAPSKTIPEVLEDSLIGQQLHTASSHPVNKVHG
jgi:hypothetical protein